MQNEIKTLVTVTDKGRLLAPMDLLNCFCGEHKGERLLLSLSVLGNNVSEAQRGYYYGYIVPEIRAGFLELGTCYTPGQVDELLRRECPLMYGDSGEPLGLSDLKGDGMTKFLDWCKQYAAENLCIFIDDPNTLAR